MGKAWLPALLKETRQGNPAQKKSLSNRRGDRTGILIGKILEELVASSCIFFSLLAMILPIRIHSQRFRKQRRGREWEQNSTHVCNACSLCLLPPAPLSPFNACSLCLLLPAPLSPFYACSLCLLPWAPLSPSGPLFFLIVAIFPVGTSHWDVGTVRTEPLRAFHSFQTLLIW